MPAEATPTDRHAPILAELAELGLSLARAVQERALAAETSEEMAEMAMAFHRISRSVRQTLALEAKLARDRARQAQADEIEAIRTRPQRTTERKRAVHAAVQRMIWNEAEGLEAELLLDCLDEALTEESLADDFVTAPIDVLIERIREDLGMDEEPVDDAEPKDVATAEAGRRSSA